MRWQCSWIYGLAACALAACSDSASPSDLAQPNFRAVVTTLNFSFPIEQTVFIPCANGGTGEFVTLSGRLHEKIENLQGYDMLLTSIQTSVIGRSRVDEEWNESFRIKGIREVLP